MKSIIGTKVGMTQIYDQSGNSIPVTVVAAGPCVVTGIRTKEKDGYSAVQLGYGDRKEKAVNKPTAGFFKKNNIAVKKVMREFRTNDVAGIALGQEIKADVFKAGDYVDISGLSKGKGFAGGVKRHNFKGGPTTHGQSDRLRAPGSLGAQGWQRVIKGLRMAGHLGHEIVTIQKLEIAAVDPQKNLLLIKGAVPGANKAIIVINETVKRRKAKVVVKAAPAKKKGGPAAEKPKK